MKDDKHDRSTSGILMWKVSISSYQILYLNKQVNTKNIKNIHITESNTINYYLLHLNFIIVFISN